MKKKILTFLLASSMIFSGVSCSGSGAAEESEISEITDSFDGQNQQDSSADANEENQDKEQVQNGNQDNAPAQNDNQSQPEQSDNGVFIDNAWAAFLVSPAQPAYTNKEDGYKILDVLCQDSVIGDIASMSRDAQAPEDTVAYDDKVITAGGPVSTGMLAYGRLSEIPDSFLNAMVSQMKSDIGEEYGNHSGGAGMGYRTFYQASYDADGGYLQVNQTDGYWARTLGAYSEHCAGVAVDFDISYNNSEFLASLGRWNRGDKTPANVEFTWLADNAHKYGFIWRYKIDGSSESLYGMRTGTIKEGWHWRFVGVYNATQFWNRCSGDTDGDGVPEGYVKGDDYIWEDYYVENIYSNPSYPQDMLEAFTEFYNSPAGNKCTYEEYISMK